MGKALDTEKYDPERGYTNMLHVWEEILLSTLQRENHISAFNLGIMDYYQFLDKRYTNLYKLGKRQKQRILELLSSFIEIFPSGFIPAGTIIFEVRSDIGNELYDKMTILYFSEENEPNLLDDPYISKFDSNRLFSDQKTSFLNTHLFVTESDDKNNELTLAIVPNVSPIPYPDFFIELFKPPTDSFDGLHDISVLLRDSMEKVLIFDLREI